jgi:RNA polymerase sigma factor (sigma-70 family)
MTPNRLEPVLRHVRTLGGDPVADCPDAVLLARFAAGCDEAAFAVLVRRHGPMVLGLCRRLLADHHAAEDAFQATFLLLARKARRLRRPDRLGPWLYGVARRVAIKARSAAYRRREVAAVDLPVAERAMTDDLRPQLDAAIAGLPARYRVPVVLCYLQGLTYAEAAERLRCPPGTVATRLSRARERLRVLLLRQGVAPAAGALTAALTPDATAALVPDELVRSTARWAAALAAGSAAAIPAPILTLTREVAQAMIFDKLKVLAVLVVLGVAGAGTGVALSRPAGAESQSKATAPVAKADAAPDAGHTGWRTVPMALLRQKPPSVYLLDAGDLLGVFVEGVMGEKGMNPPIVNIAPPLTGSPPPPAVGFPIPVQEDGTVILPLLKPIPVKGMSTTELQALIARTYLDQRLIGEGQRVLVSLARPRTYRVTVVRPSDGANQNAVATVELSAYENDILTALARTGVPSPGPDGAVIIQRDAPDAVAAPAPGPPPGPAPPQGSAPTPPPAPNTNRPPAVTSNPLDVHQIRIPMRVRQDQPLPFKLDDVILKTGDVILIESERVTLPPPPPVADTSQPPGGTVAVSLAVASPDGHILVQLPGGAWKMFDAAKITATETDGRPVAAVAERLKTMTSVLVATDGKPPTPQQVQLAKPGTLVLIIKD